MKNILILALMLIASITFAQDLQTNLRIAQDSKGKLAALMIYDITKKGTDLEFDCKNAEIDFTLKLTTLVKIDTTKGYIVKTYDTDDTDLVSFISKKGKLISICIIQANGVKLFYMNSEIKRKESPAITYKL